MASKRERAWNEWAEIKVTQIMHELIMPIEMKAAMRTEIRQMIEWGETELVLPVGVEIRRRHRPTVGHNDR